MNSKAEYLKRYMDAPELKRKRRMKKKRKVRQPVGFKIIEDPSEVVFPAQEEEQEEGPAVEEIDVEAERVRKIEELERKRRAWIEVESSDLSGVGTSIGIVEQEVLMKTNHVASELDVDASPPRKRRHPSPDMNARQTSPSGRAIRMRHDSPDRSPRHGADASAMDASPPRRQRNDSSDSEAEPSPPRRRLRHDSESDASPPRKRRHDSPEPGKPTFRSRHDSPDVDSSPPRRRRHDSPSPEPDASPPRKREHMLKPDSSPPRKRPQNAQADSSPPRRHSVSPTQPQSKIAMASGVQAGLVSGKALTAVMKEKRKKEEERFRGLSDEITGRGAETRYRKGESEDEAEEEVVMVWGRGQVSKKDLAHEQDRTEAEKNAPLARYADDEELNAFQKAQIRWGDPMAGQTGADSGEDDGNSKKKKKKKKKRKRESKDKRKRVYKGPPPPPNRFGIQPGHRWDGVDRSNGWEREIFKKQSSNIANELEAYHWSVAEM